MKRTLLCVAACLSAAALVSSCGVSRKTSEGNNEVSDKNVSVVDGTVADKPVADNGVNDNMKDLVVSPEDPDHRMDPGFLILSDDQRSMILNNNDFALKLFRNVSGFDSKVISPFSVTNLMVMLADGAQGRTKEEILETLGWKGADLNEVTALCAFLNRNASAVDPAVTVNVADYIAVNKNFKLKDDYVELVKDSFDAGVESLDFSSPKSARHINSWCSKHTDGMIPSIIDATDPSAALYMMNAIYFNGSWSEKFDKSQTKFENFRGYTRDIKKVYMMHNEDEYRYADCNDYSVVRIPYGNGSYSMTVILPSAGKSIPDVLGKLTAKELSELNGRMEKCIVDLKLPRFTTEVEQPLNDVVSALGAPSIFSSNADFGAMSNDPLSVSKMFQKAKIEVSEEGTKAAAVTAAIMVMSALPIDEPRRVNFHADRPFLYYISDSSNGVILFLGQFTGE